MQIDRSSTAGLLAALALALAPAGAGAQERDTGVRYVVAGGAGATVRNLFSRNGLALKKLAPGDVLAVHGSEGEWLEVEVPGGVPVWVFGRFLRATADPGVLEVTGNNVFQRPRPSSDTSSFPLRQRLYARDRVALIQRQDEGRPLAEDWVQVWSAPGSRAWVAAAETAPLPAGASGTKMWAQAVLQAESQRASARPAAATTEPPAAGSGTQASGGGAQVSENEVLAALGQADELFAAERTKSDPDYAAVRAAYEKVVEMAGAGMTAELAQSRLRHVQALQEVLDLQAENAELLAEHEQRMREREAAIAAAGRKADPFAGRFLARGWLERAETTPSGTVWVLEWDGARRAQVVCESGRYDLSLFEGFQLGVRGRQLFDSSATGAGLVPDAPVLDVARIEVLAGRGQGDW